MPYPPEATTRRIRRLGKVRAQRLLVRPSTKSEPPATRETLPSYNAIRDVVAKHKATLKDIRWGTDHACRTVGCVAVPESKTVAAAKP